MGARVQLRRELSHSKVELALLMGEKDELEHVAKRLNKQLAEVAARQQRDQKAA